MKNILLISPPIEEPDCSQYLNKKVFKRYFGRMNPYFHSYGSQPLGLLKIATNLRKKRCKVRLIDCKADLTGNKKNSIFRRTFLGYRKCGNYKNEGVKLRVDLCGLPYGEFWEILKKEPKPNEIYVTSGLTYHNRPVHRIIDICKEVFPDVPLSLGGIYATLCYEEAKKSKADYVHRGLIEEAKHEWVNLDILDYKPKYSVIKTTYGCPNNCTYCSVHKLEGHKMDFRDPADVIEEIKDKIKRYDIRHFMFWESNILVNYEGHFEKILDGIIKERLDIKIEFPEGLQPNLVTKEIVKKMRKAGLTHIYLPLETSNPAISRRLKRPSRLEDFERAVQSFKEVGLDGRYIGCFILAGLPNQKIEDVIESVRYVWKLGCKPSIMPFTPVPMSEEFVKNFSNKRDIRYEELHPSLWPFANENMKIHDLMCISAVDNIASPLFYVFLMKNNREFFKKVFTKKEIDYLWNLLKRNNTKFEAYILKMSKEKNILPYRV